jgi:hypothetical protein
LKNRRFFKKCVNQEFHFVITVPLFVRRKKGRGGGGDMVDSSLSIFSVEKEHLAYVNCNLMAVNIIAL